MLFNAQMGKRQEEHCNIHVLSGQFALHTNSTIADHSYYLLIIS